MPAYVLRYWESEFKLLRPKKNAAGQRLYRNRDLELVKRIKTLLYDERLTLEGAKKRLLGESRGTGWSSSWRAMLEEAIRRTRTRCGASASTSPRCRRPLGLSSPSATIPVEVGAWRSPVAHMTGGHGVAGSNPVAPTIYDGARRDCAAAVISPRHQR